MPVQKKNETGRTGVAKLHGTISMEYTPDRTLRQPLAFHGGAGGSRPLRTEAREKNREAEKQKRQRKYKNKNNTEAIEANTGKNQRADTTKLNTNTQKDTKRHAKTQKDEEKIKHTYPAILPYNTHTPAGRAGSAVQSRRTPTGSTASQEPSV